MKIHPWQSAPAAVLAATLVFASAVRAQSQPLADMIFVVDSSGTMSEEVDAFEDWINTIAQSAGENFVDAQVILIATDEPCVPAPLGSGACGAGGLDNNPPSYRHIVQEVGSGDALQQLLDTYSQWAGFLRPGAVRAITVVTDSDSELSADDFESTLLSLDPGFAGYRFHGLVADFVAVLPLSQCQLDNIALEPGVEYLRLIGRTGGVLGNLCNGPGAFPAAFTAIAESMLNDTGPGTPPEPPPPVFDPSRAFIALQSRELKSGMLTIGLDGNLVDASITGTYTVELMLTGGTAGAITRSCDVALESLAVPAKVMSSSDGVELRCEIKCQGARGNKATIKAGIDVANQALASEYTGSVIIRRGEQVLSQATTSGALVQY